MNYRHMTPPSQVDLKDLFPPLPCQTSDGQQVILWIKKLWIIGAQNRVNDHLPSLPSPRKSHNPNDGSTRLPQPFDE